MPRPDGLPDPVTVADLYLAEILKELRDQRKPPVAPASPVVDRVQEPERFKRHK